MATPSHFQIINKNQFFKQNSSFAIRVGNTFEIDSKMRGPQHANMDLISQLNKDELVKGLPKINFQKYKVCEGCQVGKQIKNSFKNKNFISRSKSLELLHMDLFGPSRTPSLRGKSYAYVILDDFPRYTWVLFLSQKNETFY